MGGGGTGDACDDFESCMNFIFDPWKNIERRSIWNAWCYRSKLMTSLMIFLTIGWVHEGEATHVQNTGFIMEFGKPRYHNNVLNMCLTLKSLVSKLVPLYWFSTICFELRLETEVLNLAKPPYWIRSWNQMFTTNEKRDHQDPWSYAHIKAEILLPWLNKLHLKTDIFECVWIHMRFHPKGMYLEIKHGIHENITWHAKIS